MSTVSSTTVPPSGITGRPELTTASAAAVTTPDRSAVRVLLLPLLVGLAALAGCRDTTVPESPAAMGDRRALMANSAGMLPVHLQQSFEPETENPEYALMPCGSGASLPNRFRAEGVLTPHMGRTQSILIAVSCSLGADSIRVAGLARHAGATGDTLYGLWGGFVTNLQGGTGTLTLRMVLVRGTGRLQNLVGDVEATGEIDLSTRTGSYRGTGRLFDRPPLPPGAVQLLPETITTGYFYSCGLSASGAAYCWGRNNFGQLGDGTTVSHSIPTAVAGGLTFKQISASNQGEYGTVWDVGHTCGITSTGTAYCWGANALGQLGDGTKTNHSTPVQVAGGLTFTQISAGHTHTCGVTNSGAAYCWGENDAGKLGTGEGPGSANRASPAAVLGGIVFEQISAGGWHTCGVTPSGVAFCWGNGFYGTLGTGSTGSSNTPYPVAGGLLFKEISAGLRHTCGVSTSGTGYCWGWNYDGQVGNGSVTGYTNPGLLVPTAVAGGLTFARISAGDYHSCGVTASGPAYCWGSNIRGELGNGTSGAADKVLTPTLVLGGLSFQQISAGFAHTCAVTSSGLGYCWGANDNGALGDGTGAQRNLPALLGRLTLSFDRLSAGGYHTCALTPTDKAYCWGADYSGQLGDGTSIVSRLNPAAVIGGLTFDQISGGYNHSCGLTINGAAYCWGNNSSGQLGGGTTASASEPTAVSGGLVFSRVQAGIDHTCGIANTGVVYCWGGNGHGQLGDGTTTAHLTPTAVSGGYLFADLAVGGYHTCALAKAGKAYCWGNDGVIEYHAPTAVSGDRIFTELSAGDRFTCGLSGGAAYCWGSNANGQLGDGTTLNHPFPAPVSGGLSFTQLTTGESHACAVTPSGSTYCWGWNYYGQLGEGSATQWSTPVAVAGGLTFSRISAGLNHSCGLATTGEAYCWGRGDYGQTGGGTRLIPTIITAISLKL